jgi:hypothetical protein
MDAKSCDFLSKGLKREHAAGIKEQGVDIKRSQKQNIVWSSVARGDMPVLNLFGINDAAFDQKFFTKQITVVRIKLSHGRQGFKHMFSKFERIFLLNLKKHADKKPAFLPQNQIYFSMTNFTGLPHPKSTIFMLKNVNIYT